MKEVWIVKETTWCGDWPENETIVGVFGSSFKAKTYIRDQEEKIGKKETQYYPYSEVINWLAELSGVNIGEGSNISETVAGILANHPDLDKTKLEMSLGLSSEEASEIGLKKTWNIEKFEVL